MKRFLNVIQSLAGILFLLISVLYFWRIGVSKALPYVGLFFLLYLPARSIFLKKFARILKYFLLLFFTLIIIYQEVDPNYSGYTRSRCLECINRLDSLYNEKLKGWYEPYEELTLTTGIGKIHMLQSGSQDSPACILLGPSRFGAWSWIFNIGELNEQYCVYAIDIASGSKKPAICDKQVHSFTSYTDGSYLNEILDKLSIESAVFIGVSDGANFALNYALKNPERVTDMILVSPLECSRSLVYDLQMRISELLPLQFITNIVFKDNYGNSWISRSMCKDWFELFQSCVYPGSFRSTYSQPGDFDKLQTPCCIVYGSEDTLADYEYLKGSNDQIHVIEVSGRHLLNIEDSGYINQIFRNYLKR